MLGRVRAHWPTIIAAATVVAFCGIIALVYHQGHEITDLNQKVVRITEVVEGTPGEPGKPGKPGIGVEAVIVHSLAPGSDPRANLNHGLLRLWLPAGMPGPRGARGPAGRDGRPGRNGQPGGSISTRQLRAAVNAFLRSHTLRCRRDGHVLVCRIAN